MELYNQLTSKNIKTFNETWNTFMFNMEELKILKSLKLNLTEVLEASLGYL